MLQEILTPGQLEFREDISKNTLFQTIFQDADKMVEIELEYKLTKSHRHYHTLSNHIVPMLKRIRKNSGWSKEGNILAIATYFHDAIYQPRHEDSSNVESSANYFLECANTTLNQNNTVDTIFNLIMETAEYFTGPVDAPGRTDLFRDFLTYDVYELLRSDNIETLIENGERLFKEFQHLPFYQWKRNTLAFLNKFKELNKIHNPEIFEEYIRYIERKKISIGLYVGSFNPFHNGHLNILEKAEKIFDKVIVAKGQNGSKTGNTLHDVDLYSILPNRQTGKYYCSTATLVKIIEKRDKCKVTLIRGLRSGTDFDYESAAMQYLEDWKPDIRVVYISGDIEVRHISSSSCRSLEKLENGEYYERYIPKRGYPHTLGGEVDLEYY